MLDELTFGVFGLEDLPAQMGWLHDPDNPYLEFSKWGGRIAAMALTTARSISKAGADICLIAGCFEEGTLVDTPDGLKFIQDMRVGDRVTSIDVPSRVSDPFPASDADVEQAPPEELRIIDLVLRSQGENEAVTVQLLRTVSWLRTQYVKGHPEDGSEWVGRSLLVIVPELEIAAWAEILNVTPARAIADGPGELVTGTFKTAATPVIEVQLDGSAEPLVCTSGHPILSLDRNTYVPASELLPGERVHSSTCAEGIRVVAVRALSETRPVYNVEVAGQHRYSVGELGVTAHNAGPCGKIAGLLPAGAGKTTKHHIFPQRKDLAKKFREVGIDIHEHTIDLPEKIHIDIHRGARGGPWNKAWERFFDANPRASREDVFRHAGKLIYDFHLPGKAIKRYRR